MNTKRAIIAILLVTFATVFCSFGYEQASQKDEPVPKTIKLVFIQKHSMVDYSMAETYVQTKIDEKLTRVEEHEERKAKYQELAKTEHEEYLAALEQQRKARQIASQVTYSEPTVSEAPADGSSRTYHVTGYVATGNPCASGVMPEAGITVASNSLPLGTRVYIEGIGERVVQDTGGMGGGTLDVFCSSESECFALTGDYEVYIIED